MGYMYFSEQMDLGDLADDFRDEYESANTREERQIVCDKMNSDARAKTWGFVFSLDDENKLFLNARE